MHDRAAAPGIVDTHCHLLPGLDDGPRSLDEAESLARELVAHGVSTVVCTPHLSRQFPTRSVKAREALGALRRRLEPAGLPLELRLAAEVSDAFSVTLPTTELELWSIRRRYLLVEAVESTRASVFELVTTRLRAVGLLPILAHPERSRAVQEDLRVVDSARRHGALVQVVAPSIVGRWGTTVQATALALVESGRADLVASDAHGVARRRCRLLEAHDEVVRRVGAARWRELTTTRPLEVAGEPSLPELA